MRTRRKVETAWIVWHCSATPPSMDGVGVADIDKWHKKRGWQGIGYHFVIKRNGKIEVGEHPYNRGAHVKGSNFNSVGVCLIGGVDEGGDPESNFTNEQQDSAFTLAKVLESMFPRAEHRGHRDFSPDLDGDGEIEKWEWMKACPVFDAKETFTTNTWVADPGKEKEEQPDGNDDLGSTGSTGDSPALPKKGRRSKKARKDSKSKSILEG